MGFNTTRSCSNNAGLFIPIISKNIKVLLKNRNLFVDEKIKREAKKGVKNHIPLSCKINFTTKQAKNIFCKLAKRRLIFFWKYKWNKENPKNIILIGGAGTGKSTALFILLNKLFNVFSINLFSGEYNYIMIGIGRWSEKCFWEKEEKINEVKNKEKCILVLDGFDEYFDRVYYQVQNLGYDPVSKDYIDAYELLDKIFAHLYSFKSVIISTRYYPIIEEQKQKDWLYLSLNPLSEEQIFQSLKKRYRRKFPFFLKLSKAYQNLILNLEQNPSLLNKLCTRPLLLDFIDELADFKYYLTEKEIIGVIDYEHFKPYEVHRDSKIFKKNSISSKKEFIQEYKNYVSKISNAKLRNRLLKNEKLTLEKAKKVISLSNYTDIYIFITEQWHIREANRKLRLGEKDENIFRKVMPKICASSANKMAEAKSEEISSGKF